MSKAYIYNKNFKGINFSKDKLPIGEYENCTFVNCIFSGSDLSIINFTECGFENCDFSLAKITNTAFRNVKFRGCKLLGLHFENCNIFLLAVDFEGCILNLSSFYRLRLKKTLFNGCSLKEVDFTEADLTGAVFEDCDMQGTIFGKTILEKADFRTSYNYSIDPEANRIKRAKFSRPGIAGLLDKYNIEIEN